MIYYCTRHFYFAPPGSSLTDITHPKSLAWQPTELGERQERRACVKSRTTQTNEIQIPVRPTDDVLFGTKALTMIELISGLRFAIPSTWPTSLQHTACFMFSVSFPTVTLCFRTENRTFKQKGPQVLKNPFSIQSSREMLHTAFILFNLKDMYSCKNIYAHIVK